MKKPTKKTETNVPFKEELSSISVFVSLFNSALAITLTPFGKIENVNDYTFIILDNF